MNELVIGDKTYISSKRAAEITGYAKDYVGQLCREGYVDAKMVGRSWYVLESSIREHRFGKPEEVQDEKVVSSVNEVPTVPAWTPPTYVPEQPTKIPTLDREPVRYESAPAEAGNPQNAGDSSAALSEMQSAWKEWYATRQSVEEESEEEEEIDEAMPEDEEEAPLEEEIEETQPQIEEDSVSIPLYKVREPRHADILPVKKAPEAGPEGIIRSMSAPKRPQQEKSGANVIVMALLVVVAGLVVMIGIIGSGFAEEYVDNNLILRYLGGKSTIYK